MALNLYNSIIKCHNTRAEISEIPSMSWHLDDNMPGKVLNVHVNVPIDTKLSTCKIHKKYIKHFSGTCHIARVWRNRISVNRLIPTHSLVPLVACDFGSLLGFFVLFIQFQFFLFNKNSSGCLVGWYVILVDTKNGVAVATELRSL